MEHAVDIFCRRSAESLKRNAEKVRENARRLRESEKVDDVLLSAWLDGMAHGLEVAGIAFEGEEVAA